MINDLAQNIGMDMICYVNPVTLETIAFPKNILEEIDWEDDLEEDGMKTKFSEDDLFRKRPKKNSHGMGKVHHRRATGIR